MYRQPLGTGAIDQQQSRIVSVLPLNVTKAEGIPFWNGLPLSSSRLISRGSLAFRRACT